jgi:hypothetical protein
MMQSQIQKDIRMKEGSFFFMIYLHYMSFGIIHSISSNSIRKGKKGGYFFIQEFTNLLLLDNSYESAGAAHKRHHLALRKYLCYTSNFRSS